MKRVAIVQSSYIPWKGYFDLIRAVDEFILLDDVQYTKRDWRNRNQIKTPRGLLWLTIPVQVKGRYLQKINETLVAHPDWPQEHWRAIVHSYARASYFDRYRSRFEELYLNCQERYLSRINHRFLMALCSMLGIETTVSWSGDYESQGTKTERLIHLCQKAGGGEYLSGPSAQSYLKQELFGEAGIRLSFADYSGYPEYPQLFLPFEHHVSIIDLIFNEGPHATHYMKDLLSSEPIHVPGE